MDEAARTTEFVAILVYQNPQGFRTIAPFECSASHPEIAYQLAVSAAEESRYGNRFVGFAEFDVKTGEVPDIAQSEMGDAAELVVEKDALSAFHDPRWEGVPHDPDELATALAGPPLLFELYGLDSIAWDELSHAYGPAADVRLDLERLASSDPQVREGALWELYGSIYHQGDIYSATAAAIPFLFRLVAVESLPNRQEILKLLADIGESSMIGANLTHENWVQRRELGGEIYDRPTEEMEREEIENRLAVRKVLQDSEDEIREFMSDTDPAIREIAESLYATITGPEVTRYIELPDIDSPPEPIPCPHCGKMLNTGAAKQCFQCGADWH